MADFKLVTKRIVNEGEVTLPDDAVTYDLQVEGSNTVRVTALVPC